MMRRLTKAGNKLTAILTGTFAFLFILYGSLSLWDMYKTEIKAFASYDLLQYRPNIEEDEPPYLDDLVEINPDTKAWLTIYNTNIDYPVMQGKDDMEYLNKDAYGKFSMSGSVYLSYKNSGDFSDYFSLIYGHHMANGSMFGDIDKFLNKSFFDANEAGVLIMQSIAYNLKIFAVLETDAYDLDIFTEYSESCIERAKYRREVAPEKVIALSTCNDARTDGRTVLLCSASVRTEPLPSREEGKSIQRKAVGHPMSGAYWALLNLFALLSTIYISIVAVFRKYIKGRVRIFLIIGISLISVLVFYITEDPHKPIQMVDAWTPLMILLAAGPCLLARGRTHPNRRKDV